MRVVEALLAGGRHPGFLARGDRLSSAACDWVPFQRHLPLVYLQKPVHVGTPNM